MGKEIYFDNSATTRLRDDVIDIILQSYTEAYGNPSSLHKKGIQAEKRVNTARETIAKAINCIGSEIILTSGGTEANNLAIKGIAHRYKRRGMHLITSKIEHPSVLNAFKFLEQEGFNVSYIDVDNDGVILLEELKKNITSETILVSIMMVNNEVGSIQPIERISKIFEEYGHEIILHVDAVQALGKIPIDVQKMGIDLLTVSGHKLHGPKGSGALFLRNGLNLQPLFDGGGQEHGLRSGTENVPAIVGLGKAVEIALAEIDDFNDNITNLKKLLIDRILQEISDTYLNGPDVDSCYSVPHIANISFKGIKGEILVHAMEEHGVYMSTGSACSSRRAHKSHVLDAMSFDTGRIEGSVRFSFSIFNTEEEVNFCVDKLKEAVEELRTIIRR